MMKRTTKQVTYGALYLVLWAGLIFGVYSFTTKVVSPTCFDNIKNQDEEAVDCGGSCQSCAIKELVPIRFGSLSVAPMGQESVAFLELQNSNSTFGAEQLAYTLTFFDAAGNALYVQKETTFVYPSEVKPKVILNVPVLFDKVSRVSATTTRVLWQSADQFSAPRVQIREQNSQLQPNALREIVQGIVKNDNAYDLSRITIQAVILSADGLLRSASKTVVQDLIPGEERHFQIILPLPVDAPRAVIEPRLSIEAER